MCPSCHSNDRAAGSEKSLRPAAKEDRRSSGTETRRRMAVLLAALVAALCFLALVLPGSLPMQFHLPVDRPLILDARTALAFSTVLAGAFLAMGRLFYPGQKTAAAIFCAADPQPASPSPRPRLEKGPSASEPVKQAAGTPAGGAASPVPDSPAGPQTACGPLPAATASPQPVRPPRVYDRVDAAFALCAFVLGYLFLRLVTVFYAGAGVTIFAALYAVLVLAYAHCSGVRCSRAGWGWLAFFLADSLLFLRGIAAPLQPTALLFLAGLAVYWTLVLFGARLSGRVDGCLGGDLRNAFWWGPFGNFSALPGALAHGLKRRGQGQKQRGAAAPAVLLGILLTLLLMPLVLFLLAGADPSFERALSVLFGWIDFDFPSVFLRLVLAVPVSFYLFGLFWGARRRAGLRGSAEKLCQAAEKRRSLGFAAAGIPIAALLAVYLIFFAAQLPYFVSAFSDLLPAGFTYAGYARRGFFELLWVTAVNLALLFFLKRRVRPGGRARRVLSALLCGATLLLLGTAARKLGLYIGIFGLTRKRVWAAWAMALVGVVVLLALADEFRRLPLARALALLCCGWFFLLCAVNVDSLVLRYNCAAWQAGRIEEMDVSAIDPVFAAGALYEIRWSASDAGLRQRCEEALGRAANRERLRAESGDRAAGFTLAGLRASRLAEKT